MSLEAFRVYLLCLAALSATTALVLDGVMYRRVLKPLVELVEHTSPRPFRLPPQLRFMLEHSWARRLYHAAFTLVVLVMWWYLGTPAGERLFG